CNRIAVAGNAPIISRPSQGSGRSTVATGNILCRTPQVLCGRIAVAMKIEALRKVSIGPSLDSILIHHRRVREISTESYRQPPEASIGVTPSRAATADSVDDCSGVKPPDGKDSNVKGWLT